MSKHINPNILDNPKVFSLVNPKHTHILCPLHMFISFYRSATKQTQIITKSYHFFFNRFTQIRSINNPFNFYHYKLNHNKKHGHNSFTQNPNSNKQPFLVFCFYKPKHLRKKNCFFLLKEFKIWKKISGRLFFMFWCSFCVFLLSGRNSTTCLL